MYISFLLMSISFAFGPVFQWNMGLRLYSTTSCLSLSTTQIKCKRNANICTYILYGVVMEMRYIWGLVSRFKNKSGHGKKKKNYFHNVKSNVLPDQSRWLRPPMPQFCIGYTNMLVSKTLKFALPPMPNIKFVLPPMQNPNANGM